MKAIAVKGMTNFGGMAIYDIDGDYVKWGYEFGNKKEKIHTSKIYYTVSSGRPYFKVNGRREYLDEFMRV